MVAQPYAWFGPGCAAAHWSPEVLSALPRVVCHSTMRAPFEWAPPKRAARRIEPEAPRVPLESL